MEDRIVCISNLGTNTVPFGSYGTIIGQNYDLAIIRFDKKILTGTNKYLENERFHEAIVEKKCLLNLTR